MADELTHKDPGSELTQAEYISSDGTGHVFESQATGDILYASSATVLSRLEKATDGNILELASNLPAWTASPTIGSTNWGNANHAHAASNSGGTLTTLGTITTGVWNGTAIATAYIGADAITGAKIADDALDSEHYTDGSIDTAHLAADAVTGAKIADDAIDSEHYADGSIDNAHIADDAIDSEHYAAGSIDTAHIADNQVTAAKIFDLARGSVLYGNGSAVTAELTKGSANTVLTSDGTDISWAAASSGAITREGGQTSEGTTTSTSSVDLITASSLTVLATQHGYLALCARNSSGGAVTGQLGLKLNSTVVGESDESALWRGTSANADQTGGTRAWWGQTLTNYQSSGGCLIHASTTATGATVHGGVGSIPSTNPIPIATITDVVIRAGQTGGGGRTIAADELSVYSYATS